MKRLALFAATAALMATTPAAAAGFLGVEYGSSDIDFLGGAETDTWQGEGAYGWVGGNWGAQIGGSFGNTEFGSGSDADVVVLDGHVYWRNDNWRVGGVIATTQIDSSGGSSIEEWSYGVEAMVDVSPNLNFFADALMGEAEFLADADTWNLDAGVNFYASPNVRFSGLIGYGNLDFSGGDSDALSVGVTGEFQPWSAPVSLTLGWNHFEADDAGMETNAFRVGARWNFGGGALQDRDETIPFTTHGGFLDRFYGVW